MERECEHCGKSFHPKRVDAAYCSHSCRQQAYLARKVEQGIQSFGGMVFDPKELNEMTDKQEPSLSVTNEEEQQPIQKEKPGETEQKVSTDEKLKDYESNFLEYISERLMFRNYDFFLSPFQIRFPALSNWINTRYLCLVESLLAVSEMRTVDLDDLKDICNAFHLLLNSETFKNMPVNYPYRNEMIKYYDTIRQFCISSIEETTMIRFTRTTKAELLASRFELVHYVSWVRFDQLNFSE